MKKITLLLLLVLARFAASGQCTPNLTVAYTDPSAPVLCADPATGLYIVDPAYELQITLEDAVGAPLTFTLNNNDWIYVAPGQTGPLPNPGGSGQTSPPLPSVYWNGNPHAGGAGNTNPVSGAQDYTSYQYTGTFTIPGCGQDTFDITLITTGFTYDDLCRGDVKDLTDLENDIPILGNYPSITWYDDAAATTALPSNTQLQFNEIYYADLGLGCSLVPVQISSKSPVPQAASMQEFCTAATWAAAGFPAQPGDTIEDLIICGQNLTWYSDAAGTTIIPATTALVQGQTYYVSQTVLGCESDLLAITVTEQECACLENPSFQDQGGNFNPDGFDFYSNSFSSISACQGQDYMPGATSVNGASIPANDQGSLLSYATAGNNIPVLTPHSVYIPTTSPFGCSSNSIKLNDNLSGGKTVGILEKEFIAGEVLVFDFALVFENPAGHSFAEQPFMTIRVFDQNGNLVQTRCVVSNPDDCIFKQANSTGTPILYSEWSCIKLNTGELQGQKAKLQVTIGDCDLGGHWATGYLDNFYTGDDVAGVCDDSAFGFLSIVPVDDGTDGYASCSLFDVPQDPNCAPALSALNPQFPINVYFDYDTPIGGQLSQLDFDIYDANGNSVFSPAPSTINTDPVTGYYYYTVNQSDLPAGMPFGTFSFGGDALYSMQNCGTQPYTYPVQAISNGFKICPTAGCPPAVSFCGTTGSSFSVDLEDPNTQSAVLDGMNASDLSFTYWTDQNDALNGSGPSQIPAANINNYTVTTSTTVYIRIDAIPAIADCYDVVPLDILIGDVPAVPATIADMNICGGGTVDLTTQDAAASAQATTTVSVTYFDDLNNAQNNLSPIANPTNYSPAVTTTIYARVENAEGCYDITTFDVVVGTPPNYNPPANIAECDLGTQDGFTQFDLNAAANQIIGGNPNTSVDFYETQAGADAQDPNDLLPLNYTNTTANQQTIYVYIEDTSNGCYVVEPLTLDVIPAPVANPAGPLFACDNDGDGSEDFVLTAMDNTISGGGANLAVTYHASLANAQAGTAALNSPYTASGATTTIYARLEDTSGAGCYDTVAIDLEIGDAPNLPASIPNLEACDDAQNGVQTFDLTSQAAAITANMANPAGATLTYYASQTDYNNGTPIPGANLTAYDNISNPQSIVVEVEGANTCIATITFDLVVNPLPTYNTPNLYSICDQGAQDGIATFDLSVATAQITAGFANLNLSYYELQADANAANTNTLANNYDNTTPYNQTIYVLIEDTTTGCTIVDQLDLEVVASPTVNPAGPLELCDANLDGSETFNLASLTATIEGGAAGSVTTTYHPTQADADNATATLPMNYSTVTTTIYARVEDNGPAGCYNTIAVDLNVLPSPDLVTNLPALEACDDAQNGVQTFDLTSQSAAILANEATPANFTLTYYASQADYTAGTAIANPTAYDNTSNPQSIVVEAEGPNNCTSTTSFDLVVNPLPSYNTPVTQVVCDDATADGIAVFDLTAATNQLTGNNPNYQVDYYETPADLAAGTNALPSNYTNTTAYNQTIYFQIEDQTTGCLIDDAIDLQVDTAPAANTPQVYTFCDDDNDGFGLFNLPSLDNEITGGAAGVSVSYHQTLANAQNNALPLPANFTNTINTTQVIYARVVSPGVACYTIVNVTLEVFDSPQPVLPQDLDALEACDTNNSGNAVFDLTQMEAAILANETNPSDFSLAYYESQADADAQTNPITVEQAYTSAGMNQTIYVVVTGNNGCTAQTQFELVVNPLPVITPPSALELCDYNNPGDEQEAFDLTQATLEITGGDSSMQVTYYASQNDADTGSNPLSSPYTNTVNNETIYVRVEDQDTGCFVSQGFSLTLVVNPLPSPQVPVTPLEVCDVDNDGFAEFDLDAQTPIIENGELNVAISYHITQSNAENGVNPIDTTQPYGLSSANTQTLYVRAENTQTGCYVVEVLQLEVVGSPEIGFLEDLYVCDDDYNGFAVFDLTQNTPNVVGAQTGVSVTYYESQADADAGINAIAVPQAYTNIVNPQRIFVRVEDDTTGCYDTFNTANDNSFMLYVEELPVVSNPSILQVCDDDYNNVPLSQSIFNLTSKEGEMSGQNFPPNDYTFTYYESEQAYLNGDAPIATPSAYENIANPQSIYVVVVNTDTQNQCEQYVDLTIEVLPLPSPSETDPDVLRLQECDDDNDGVATNAFDLTQSGALIAAGENVDLSYYTSEAAAEAGDTTVPEYIANPTSYTNDPSLNTVNDQGMTVQVIYVRVDSGVNGNFCFVIVPIEIQAVRVPVLTNIDPFGYTLCEDGSSGTAAINLEDIAYNLYDASVATPDPSVLVDLLDANENDDMNLSNYAISYHFDQIGAQNDTNEVPNGYQASTGDTFWIRVVYTDTGCQAAVGRVEITVEPRPVIAGIDTTLEVCSDEQGGNTATVDLTQFDAQINPGSPANTRVIYYASLDDYLNAAAPIDQNTLTAYVTTENPQTIIGVVQDTNNLCESVDYATITIEIAPRPIVDISSYDGMVICADSDSSTPVEGGNYDPVFIDTGLDEINYSFVWTLDGGVLPETGSSIEVTSAGTYTVTVTDVFSNCESSSSASFTAGNPPEFDVIPLTLAFDEQHSAQVINISGNGDYEFNIDNGPWTAVGSDGSITFNGLSAGVHFVYGRDKNGCGTTVREIAFIDYPKFFTPNEDGYNDTWNIIGLGEANIGAKIFIFDRYGKLLKQLSPSGPGWDGTFNGKPMPSNDYWFSVEYKQILPTGEERIDTFKGHFTLKR